ncbi:hypothetical protein [Thermomonas mangrovi]|uniref:hypothetical protein n=1 Tax=Thermomonas mangrovi TaxID=2993316 RepID=UPI0023074129|nr:hypothetical protein [Thermomonas mangrovi]
MAVSQSEALALAEQIAASMGIKTSRKRRLVVVGDEASEGMSALQRDAIYARIRDMAAMHGLWWLIRQETMPVNGIMECLADEQLTALLATVESGVECVLEGVPFVERGLVRGMVCNWIA